MREIVLVVVTAVGIGSLAMISMHESNCITPASNYQCIMDEDAKVYCNKVMGIEG